jgi:hypothetical protein
MFLVLIGNLSFWPSPRERDHTENSRALAKESTDQENGCQVMHELEMQNMMVLHIV